MRAKRYYDNFGYDGYEERRRGGSWRGGLLLLIVLVIGVGLVYGRIGGGGLAVYNDLNGLNGLNELAELESGYAWPERFAADSEGLFFWRRWRQELAEAAAEIRVAVYCTHSSETYTSYSGEPKVYGELGGVYRAAAALRDTLNSEGIGAVVDETIHDWPDWNRSYANSCETAEGLLAAYPQLSVLIDLHRDAGVSREASVTEINGKPAARIMLVCGSNQRYTHDDWQQNKAFMEEIAAKMEELYPGLLRRVAVQAGRYNQHLSTRAILVEMGSTENTLEEVEYSGRLLAEVLAAVLADK